MNQTMDSLKRIRESDEKDENVNRLNDEQIQIAWNNELKSDLQINNNDLQNTS